MTQSVLEEYRADLRPLLQDTYGIQVEGDRLLWRTFAGRQINHTLKYGLQFHHDWKIIADNFRLKIEGDSVSLATVNLAIERMSHADVNSRVLDMDSSEYEIPPPTAQLVHWSDSTLRGYF